MAGGGLDGDGGLLAGGDEHEALTRVHLVKVMAGGEDFDGWWGGC